MVTMGICLLAATGAQAAVEVTMHKVSPEGVARGGRGSRVLLYR